MAFDSPKNHVSQAFLLKELLIHDVEGLFQSDIEPHIMAGKVSEHGQRNEQPWDGGGSPSPISLFSHLEVPGYDYHSSICKERKNDTAITGPWSLSEHKNFDLLYEPEQTHEWIAKKAKNLS